MLDTYALESLIIVEAAASVSQPNEPPTPRDFERAEDAIERYVTVDRLSMQSPYEPFVAVLGGAASVSFAVCRAIDVFDSFQES